MSALEPVADLAEVGGTPARGGLAASVLRQVTARRIGMVFLFAVMAAAGPLIVGNNTIRFGEYDYVLVLVLVAIGLNVVTGYAGLLSLGSAAFFALGGYAAAILMSHYTRQMNLLFMCIAGIAVAVAAAVPIAVLTLRVSGFFLAIGTLFITLAIPSLAANMTLTGGGNGISLTANPHFFPRVTGIQLYELILGLVAFVAFLSHLVLRSRLGRRFLSLATSEELSTSLGVAPYQTKIWAFVLSAAPAGLAGALYVYSQGFFSATSITEALTIYLLAACVVGGFGTVAGPILGSILIIGTSIQLGSVGQYQQVIFGGVLILFAIAFPTGVVGLLTRRAGGEGDWRNPLSRQWNAFLRWVEASEANRSRSWTSSTGRKEHGGLGGSEPLSADEVASVLANQTGIEGPSHRDGGDTDGEPCLVLEGVVRSFGGVRAVAGVDMALRRGVIHGLLGSNGSGKTTVLNLITGLYSVDAGRIVFDGQDLTRMRSYQIARLGISRTFQTPMLVPQLTVLDNVLLGYEQNDGNGVFGSVVRSPRGRRADAKARSVALSALGEVGLAEVAERSAGELTHGQRRLAELTRVMVSHPSVVLLDEPAAGLSVGELERLRRVLEIMCGRGIGVLLVEHNVPFVLGMADEVTVLHEGSVIAHGPSKVIETHPDVIESFLGRLGAEASMKLADT